MAKNRIDQSFELHPHDFMKTNTVLPQDYRGRAHGALVDPEQVFDHKPHVMRGGAQIDSTLTITDAAKRLGYITLEKHGGEYDFNAYKLFVFQTAQIANHADYVPVWFLPWASNHATRMTIPTQGANTVDPSIFFTAALSGCSVFVTGTRQSPTVWHCGTMDPRSNPEHAHHYDDPAKHWRSLVRAQMTQDHTVGRLFEANRGMYRKYGSSNVTRMAETYEEFFESETSNVMQVTDINTSGCVFGVRTNGDWTFYLQKNMSIAITKLRKKKIFFKTSYVPAKRKENRYNKKGKQVAIDVDDTKVVNIPAQLYQIFPRIPKSAQAARLESTQIRFILGAYVR